MALTAPARGAADAAAPLSARLRPLTLYIGVVAVAGVAGSVLIFVNGPHWGDLRMYPAVLGLLGLALILGELRPIPISRGDDTTDNITISTTFAVALVLVGPLSFALAVQAFH